MVKMLLLTLSSIATIRPFYSRSAANVLNAAGRKLYVLTFYSDYNRE